MLVVDDSRFGSDCAERHGDRWDTAFVPLGSSVMPMLGTEDVMWTCKFRNGLIKRFKFPIRTTPEGTANAYKDLKGKDLQSGLLSTEEADGVTLRDPQRIV
jgi:adenylylsulfate reductase subunit B